MRRLDCFLLLLPLLAASAPSQTFTEVGQQVIGSFNVDARSVSFADIDNDGDPDMLFQGNGPAANRDAARQLLRNNMVEDGVLTFTNITTQGGISTPLSTGWSAAWADYNGDGFVDVFLGQSNNINSLDPRGALFRNNGNLNFTNVSASTVNDPGFHQSVAFADLNNDGLLDLVLAMEGPEMHEVYLQQADGTFIQSGDALGLHVPHGTKAYGMAIADADGDGDLDIYISTCQGGGNIRNNFFENQLIPAGTLFFVDIADQNGTQIMDNTYSAEFVDFDNDGWLDLFVIGADQFPSKIFRNNADGTYTDVDTITGRPLIDNTGGDLNGGRAVDYDNDGDLDLFFHDHARISSTAGGLRLSNVARLLYRNDGNWRFTNVTEAEGLLEVNRGSYDSALADVDLDGDLDLLATTDGNSRERLYLSNASTNGNNWFHLTLRQPAPNTRAIGTQVYATIHAGTPNERTLRRDRSSDAGAFHQSDLPVHFGLGDASRIDVLRIVWPINGAGLDDGVQEDVYYNVDVNSHTTIVRKSSALPRHGWMIF